MPWLLQGRVMRAEPEAGLVQASAGGFVLRMPACGRTVGAQVRLKISAREVMLAAAASVGRPPSLSVQNILAVPL